MAEQKLLKVGGSSAAFAQFAATDTIPGTALPGATVISPSTISSDQDNYSPAGWSDADTVRLAFDTGGRAITGFSAWTNTRPKTLVNTTGNYGYIPCEHPDSTAANRVVGVCDHIIAPYGTLILDYDGTSSRVRVIFNSFDPANQFLNRGHFYQACPGATSGGDWGHISFGISGGDNDIIEGTATLPAGWFIHTSSSASGASSLYFAKTINSPAFFGASHFISSAFVYFPVLSVTAQTYTFQHGIITGANSTTLAVNNSVCIRYSHGINSGKFEGFSRNNAGTESTVDLGTTVVENTPYLLTVCFDKAISEARFYVNGVFAGRVTGSMPNGVAVGDRSIIVKSAGTTQRNAIVANKTFCTIF